MTNDLAKTIAAACLEAIQSRPDTPTTDELADVVRPMLPEPEQVTYYGATQLTNEQIEKLRDAGFPFAGSPADRAANAPSTQELHDARPSCFEDVEVPFKLLNSRRCLTEKQVCESPEVARFVWKFRDWFDHDMDIGVFFFIERTPTPEVPDGE